MADNLSITPGTGAKAATDEVTYSGDTAMVQLVRLVDVSGAEGSKTVAALTLPVADSALATKLDTLNSAVADTSTDSPVSVHTPADVITFTPTIDTAAYTSGDVLFATAAITGVTRANDLRALLTSLTIIDKAKQNAAITLLFYQTNVTSAAANAANALSDADQITCLGYVDIAAADWKTFANNSVLCYSGAKAPNLLLEAASGTTTVYAVAITTSTPTYGSTSDLVFKLGVVQS